ncbi:hypothetical protein EGW08_021086 [Elysia chlorotica]|uniref:C3H1-type domain-containing protein n=1 Tax=Elysia chlorotica TaxID=188477 RepID=A0A433SPH8_ELYCH|nr:hypothetical protein EGW08_021086 [Elysia chlorotica]
MEVENDNTVVSTTNDETPSLATQDTQNKAELEAHTVSGPDQLEDVTEKKQTEITETNSEPVLCDLLSDKSEGCQEEQIKEKESLTPAGLEVKTEQEKEESVPNSIAGSGDASALTEGLDQNKDVTENKDLQEESGNSPVADVRSADVGPDPVSADDLEPSQPIALAIPETEASDKVDPPAELLDGHEGQVIAETSSYTDIQSPESSFLPPPVQTGSGDVYTDIRSPEGSSSPVRPVIGRVEHEYTDIQSPEAKSSSAGPSDDREDISDGELDLNIESTEKRTGAGDSSSQQVGKSGERENGVPQGSVRDAADGKLDEAGKSDAGSIADDASRVSKVPSEELEAVSDDELPEASHTKPAVTSSKAVVEGGEDVSSDDEAEDSMGKDRRETFDVNPNCASNDPEPVSPTALPEQDSPSRLAEPVSPAELPEPVSPTALAELAPLDAEPISDEEDNSGLQEEEEEDGEAGEIKSPTEDITSPPSSPGQGAANLGEVEPVSADDSNDTDGELPSDEDTSKSGNGQSKNAANFESIESEEEGDLDGSVPSKQLSQLGKSAPEGKQDGYMESISDEETMDNVSEKLSGVAAQNASAASVGPKGPFLQAVKDSSSGKVSAPNFNEHQVELDYEEAEGDDGEVKPEDSAAQTQIKEKPEEGQCPDDAASDKDEGELSDDDCEEGEIKEPGARKPFMKPMCRFFQRGNCTWGVSCRFLHPGVNDKGNYQMIEIPGFQPTGVHARLGGPGPWPEQQAPVEQMELPPPPLPDTPPPETAWERGLRIAKEQRKKATERKEQEPDFEEKRLNLSVDEERELNKENERMPKIIPKDPYYDQQAYEEDEYYKIARDPWQTGHYENFEVRYNREHSYSPPPYREKPPMPMPMPPMRYDRPYNSPPPVDKFGRDRMERREEYRVKPAAPPPPVVNDYPSPSRRPDEWVDPWRRQTNRKTSKSPTRGKHKRSRSRGRRARRSVSDSSISSRSGSGSSTGSSRSSRSYSGSSGSSSHSRSPEPAPPGVERHDRYQSPSREQPRSAVTVRGRGGGYHNNNNYDQGYRRDQQGWGRMRGGGPGGGGGRGDGGYQNRQGWGRGSGGMGRGGDGYPNRDNRDMRDRGRPRVMSPPDRPLPYVRPRPRSASSRSSSSGSRSRSRSRSRPGRDGVRGRGRSSSRSSSGSSSSRSSSSSSVGSADSEHLYRDLNSPGKSPAQGGMVAASAVKKKRVSSSSHKERGSAGVRGHPTGSQAPPPPGPQRHPGMAPPPQPTPASQQQRQHVNLDHIPIPQDRRGQRDARDSRDPRDPRDPRDSRDSRLSREAPMAGSTGRSESRYASRNAPQVPVKAKDPLKVVGQKSNIKLTLLPKQQHSSLGSRPNPLDSPPRKRRMSDRETSPVPAPPAKRMNLPLPQVSSALRLATEKAAKIQMRQEKRMSPPPPSSSSHHASMTSGGSGGPSSGPSSSSRARAPVSPQKQSSSGLKSRGPEPSIAKTAPKLPAGGGGSAMPGAGPAPSGGAKAKKSMSSRREELLKQLKAVEDAIARKKTKLT